MDVGSNALRLAIAEFTGPDKYEILDRVRMPVRLGESVFKTQRIDPATMEAALDAFRAFRRKMEQHGVVVHRAVATSATREAKNRAAFLERVRSETGLDLELIQGTEEARLVALGVKSRLSLSKGLSMILDVGGGSSEIALVGHGEIMVVESHDVGGVRLLERAGKGSPEKLLKHIQATLRSSRFPILDFFKRRRLTRLVGTGGNIDTLALLDVVQRARAGNGAERPVAKITIPRLRRMLQQLSKLTAAERAEKFNLRPDRADVIVPAGAIFEYVAARVRAREIWVPFVGLVDGVLIDVARAAGAEGRKQLEISQTRNAAIAILHKYDPEPRHAQRVAVLAVSLFDQLKTLHGMGRRDRLLLGAGGAAPRGGEFHRPERAPPPLALHHRADAHPRADRRGADGGGERRALSPEGAAGPEPRVLPGPLGGRPRARAHPGGHPARGRRAGSRPPPAGDRGVREAARFGPSAEGEDPR